MKKFFVVFALIFVSSMLSADNSDEMACKFARKVGTVDVWKNYLETYPGGSCAFEAESVLKMNKQATPRDMEANNPQDVNACSMARQKNRPDVWRIYLESYPHGICAFEAKMAITELEEKVRADRAAQDRLAAAAIAEQEQYEKLHDCNTKNRLFPCKDSKSGLMWSQAAKAERNWYEAVHYCQNLNEGGYNDWKLPSRSQLQTVNLNVKNVFPGHKDGDGSGSCAWTSDPAPDDPNNIYKDRRYLICSSSGGSSENMAPKHQVMYFRCVRYAE